MFKSMETIVGYNNQERFSTTDIKLIEAAHMVFMDFTKLAHTMFPDLSTVKMQLAKHIANIGSRSYQNPEIFKYLSNDEYGGVYNKLAKGNILHIYTFYHAVAKWKDLICPYLNMSLPTKKFLNTQLDTADDFIV
ncbi:hypothetical protein L228DRAFT_244770 [Xylona heveae TC161]|uniref:Uncharacterized protein n=1 Tax=Xylona heveae (strain CBS 132557 / TC161) TaxID=1328760 RepID=A0A165J7A3_XYLHT|nr:hypothetical protein L228DRAFT_244770 [Xylona heveae TC161]KZF25838.1 hypothetical protein L228DRAFT_244770 [Xylona heveae TC161]